MSLMGELRFFLGLRIKQGHEGTFVHQAKYTRDILKKFDMGDSKPMTTPMSTNTALDADEDGEAEFRGMIGSLRTDGDRAGHSVRGVKRIFGYRNSLPSLVFGTPRRVLGCDHAGCRIDRKSTSGTCQLLGTSLVSWSSRKQASVSLSTTKRVHRLLLAACSQLLWMKTTLSDFGLRFGKIPLLVDSTSAISVAKNPVLHSRTKHIDVRFHFLRDHYEKGDIDLVHVASENQLQVEGVDNALIKGEIESQWTGLIALLV
ncbi:hypothetical protein U9M48_019598 [Paspalum notatum var. saurae]|uniref:Reverse transcriptase Ty1/copia-type domain-containing protein n=1 Tax=Paspalum notatum var. saurae TaxID=547442 RepID=A0AAQ3TE14_PASNO